MMIVNTTKYTVMMTKQLTMYGMELTQGINSLRGANTLTLTCAHKHAQYKHTRTLTHAHTCVHTHTRTHSTHTHTHVNTTHIRTH